MLANIVCAWSSLCNHFESHRRENLLLSLLGLVLSVSVVVTIVVVAGATFVALATAYVLGDEEAVVV